MPRSFDTVGYGIKLPVKINLLLESVVSLLGGAKVEVKQKEDKIRIVYSSRFKVK